MIGFVGRRLGEVAITLLIASLLIFLLMHLAPGDPVQSALGPLAQPDTVTAMRHEYGLDRPLPLQYLRWLAHAVQGDLGRSILTREPVTRMLLDRAPATATLTLFSMVLFLLVSFPGGIIAARFRNRFPDRAILLLSTIGVGIPNFFLGILLISLVSVRLDWLPIAGYVSLGKDVGDSLRHLVLPVISLTTFYIALTTRLVRASVGDAMDEDYVRTARAKGLRERPILLRHVVRNGMIPIVTAAAINVAYLFGGSIIVEEIFAIPGLGRLLFTAVTNRDFPLIQGIALLACLTFIASSLVADALTAVLDPRLRER